MFQPEHFIYQNHINPKAQQEVTDTVTEEVQYLINNMFDNFEDFFEFDKDNEITDQEYMDWVSSMITNAVSELIPNA